MEKLVLPLSIQQFRKIRERNLLYIDKTEYIYRLVNEGESYFLSRPRRFGKSLLLSTMKEAFLGSKNLFEGLAIYDKWDWSVTNPVIHLSFADMDYQSLGLEKAIRYELRKIYSEYKIEYIEHKDEEGLKTIFKNLLESLCKKKGQVAFLVDEYDKPIIDYLNKADLPQAKANQKIMKTFYSVLKDASPYLRFVFITGVSKFSKVSLFSDLNNLLDLTMHKRYSTMTGITQAELVHYLMPHIEDVLKVKPQYSLETLLASIKEWYNGYSWDGINSLYNPYGTFLFLDNQDFLSFWFESGSPSFLVKKMQEEAYFPVESFMTTINLLNQYDLDNLRTVSLMFQAGYLTIKERYEFGEVLLDYPNREVKQALFEFLMDDMVPIQQGHSMTVKDLNKHFLNNDLSKIKLILMSMLGDLPYDVYKKQSEGLYHGLLHILFRCLGLYMQSEVHSHEGRADCIVETPTHIYLFEFKYNSTAQTGLAQIVDTNYMQRYYASEKKLIGIAVNFDSSTRQISAWEEVEIERPV